MSITDLGREFAYLIVEGDNGKQLFVRKDCRVKKFDAHWETEPVPENYKPDLTIFASNVPPELWRLLSREEILESLLAESKWKARHFAQQRNILIAILALIGWTLVIVLTLRLHAHF